MGIQQLSEETLLVCLPNDSLSTEDLEAVVDIVGLNATIDVIVDFSAVEVMPSPMLSELMILEKKLGNAGRQLILCSVPPTILKLFTCVGLNGLFTFSDDQFSALELIHSNRCYFQ